MTTRKALTFLAVVALAACGEDAKKIPTGSVSGTVTVSGAPDSSGVTVLLAGFSATTNAAGAYSFAEIPTGPQVVTAIAPRSTERTQAASVTVNAGATAGPNFTFHAVKALAGIVNKLGTPAAGVTATLTQGAATVATATTDASGVYSFGDVAAGTYSIAFSGGGVVPDAIPEVMYSGELGGIVPDTFQRDLLYKLEPFELQGATRLASLNLVLPARNITVAPFLSPDGALYAYGITNDFSTSTASLYVGSVSGGAPVKVTDTARTSTPRFSPTSKELVYFSVNPLTGRTELWSAVILPGPAVAAPVAIVDAISNYDFSPQTANANSTIYAIFTKNPTTTPITTLTERVVATGNSLNEWEGVGGFNLFKKQQRILFQQQTTTPLQNRLVTAQTTGGAVTSLRTLEAPGVTFSWGLQAISDDEAAFAYTLFSQNLGGTGTIGLKSVVTATSAPPVVVLNGDTSHFCVAFTPDKTKLVYDRAGGIFSRAADASAAEVQLLAFNSWFTCPQPAADNANVWMNYNNGATLVLSLGPVGALNGNITESGSDITQAAHPRNGSAVLFRRTNGNQTDLYVRTNAAVAAATPATKFDASTTSGSIFSVARNGAWALYIKVDLPGASNPSSVYWLNVATGAKSLVASRVNNISVNAADEIRAFVHYREDAGFLSNPSSGFTTGALDLTTGAFRPVLRRMSQAQFFDVGAGNPPATTTPKLIMSRINSLAPYRFQDGIYIVDP